MPFKEKKKKDKGKKKITLEWIVLKVSDLKNFMEKGELSFLILLLTFSINLVWRISYV